MSHHRANLLEVHQSDPDCLARFHHDATTRGRDSAASLTGTICHEIIEALTIASVTGEPDVPATVREVLARWTDRGDVAPGVVAQVVEIMAKATGPKSRLRFFLEPGWSVAPEWRWALDEEFQPIARETDSAAWMSPPAYAGTLDRLEVADTGGKVRIPDWKTILKRPAQWEVAGAWQARVYALAVLAHFPKIREVEFRFVLLRHGYFIGETFTRGEPWEQSTRAALRQMRAARVRAAQAGVWPETLGESCYYCPIKTRCAASEALRRGDGPPLTDLPDDELARRTVAVKHLAQDYDREARKRVHVSGAPLAMGDGSVLGKKPKQAMEATIEYDRALQILRGYGMTNEQEIEWFRFIRRVDFPGALKKAIYGICGSAAKGMLASGEWVQPYTSEEFGVWTPESVKVEESMTLEDLDELVDRMFEGG